jgi:hypothetical protein
VPEPPAGVARPAAETGTDARTRARHAEVHAALARGLTLTQISRALRLDRKTVRRYATATTPDQLIGGTRLARPGLLDAHQAYLRQRCDGIHSTSQLHQELRARGYTGSLRTPRRLTARLRHDTGIPPQRPHGRPRKCSPTTTAPHWPASPPATQNSPPPAARRERARRRWLTTGLGLLAAACTIALIVVPSSRGPEPGSLVRPAARSLAPACPAPRSRRDETGPVPQGRWLVSLTQWTAANPPPCHWISLMQAEPRYSR